MARLPSPCPSRRPRAPGITLSNLVQRALWADPLLPPSLPGGPTAPPVGPPYLLNPAAVLSAGPPKALLQPALQRWPQGRGTFPLPLQPAPAPHPGSLLCPKRTQLPQATRVLAQGHMRRPAQKPAPITLHLQRLSQAEGPGWVTDWDTTPVAWHILHPQPQLPSPLRLWAISYPWRLSVTSRQGGCLRSRAWCLQTAAQRVFGRSLLWKDVKAGQAHDTGPTAPAPGLMALGHRARGLGPRPAAP